MKPRLAFSNGYWSWVYENVHKTGYACIVCAGRDAAALAKKRNSEQFQRRLLDIQAKWGYRDWSDSDHAAVNDASGSLGPDTNNAAGPPPGSIIVGNEGDPGFPPKRSRLRRLLDRIF